MVKFSKCEFLIPNGQKVYRPGDEVRGFVSVTATKNISVKGIHLYLYGEAMCKWPARSYHVAGFENYVSLVLTLLGNKPNVSGEAVILTAGRHVYPFSFSLPASGIPSSFEGSCGAIRYWLKFEIVLPAPFSNHAWLRVFTVLAVADVNSRESMLPKRLTEEIPLSIFMGLRSSGKLRLNVSLDRSAYCPGEIIFVNLEVMNESSKSVGPVKVGLLQQIFYTAGRETITDYEDIIRIQATEGKIPAGVTVKMSAPPLPVDAVPPSTVPLTCHIIKVRYYVHVVTEISYEHNVNKVIPVTIGTVPLKSGSGASFMELNGAGATDVNNVSYRECRFGVKRFRHSEDNFPLHNYVPFTAYAEHNTNQSLLEFASEKSPIPVCGGTGLATNATEPENQTCNDASDSSNLGSLTRGPEPNLNMSLSPSSRFSEPSFIEAPPSYEEAITSAENPLPSFDSQDNGAILLIRFPRSDFLEVQQFFSSQNASLKFYGGHIITLCPIHLLRESNISWPTETSTAVFFFGIGTNAERWFGDIATSNLAFTSRWSVMMAENAKTRSHPNPQHLFLNVAFEKYTSKPPMEHVAKVCAIRQEFDIRVIVKSTQPKFLSGDWSGFWPSETGRRSRHLLNCHFQDVEEVEVMEKDGQSTIDKSDTFGSEFVDDPKILEHESPAENNEENANAIADCELKGHMQVVCYQYPDMTAWTEYASTILQSSEALKASEEIKKHKEVVTSVCFSGIFL